MIFLFILVVNLKTSVFSFKSFPLMWLGKQDTPDLQMFPFLAEYMESKTF